MGILQKCRAHATQEDTSMNERPPEDTWELAANISLLFAELPYLERIPAAAEAGFAAIETWWPFDTAAPDQAAIDALVDAIAGAGIRHAGLNLYAGDQAAGDRGVISRPDLADDFATNLEVVAGIAERTGCRVFNALYGQRQVGLDPAEQDELAIVNLSRAARRLADVGGTVLVEGQTRGMVGAYPIETAKDAALIVERAREHSGLDNIGVLFDTFHLTNNGDDLLEVIARYGHLIEHVQLADTPGRGEPGSGVVPFASVLEDLWACGYRATVACEYAPTTADTRDSLGWVAAMPHVRLG
jgi:hydroxypyruvate isomerase